MPRDLVSGKTRIEFREYFVGTTLAVIDDAFRAEEIEADLDFDPPVVGQRRTLVEQYYHTVDWRSASEVARVLRVFETVLIDLDLRAASDDYAAKWVSDTANRLRHWLARDGIKESDGKLSLAGHGSFDTALVSIDAPELQRQIERIRSSVDSDPSLAIGTAKELLETTCKTILTDRGVTITKGWDAPRLVKETRKALALLPNDIDASVRGSDTIRRLLANLGTVVNSLAELRNLYGTGHGKHGNARGVQPRHARLAVGSAATLATFLLETHEARD